MTREEIEKAIQCCNPYDENCGDCPFHDLPLGRCFEKLASSAFNMLLEDREKLQKQVKAYQDKIENGTLIELPCKVGDTVWYIKSYGFGRYRVEDMEVAGFNFSKYENSIWVVGKYEEQSSKIYKTREEAEARLKEIQK